MKRIIKTSTFLLLVSFLVLSFAACETEPQGPLDDVTIWSGAMMTFEKANGADPTDAVNQDRITDNVWITRGNDGGQIYNASVENSSDKATSPTGTEWAIGTTADLENLDFQPFRTAVVKPQEVVGKDLVLLLVEDRIAIDIKFTSWAGNKQGGFAYERSTN